MGHEFFQGVGYGVEHLLADVVGLYIERYAALRVVVSFDSTDALPLLVGQETQMHFWYDGVTAVFVDYADEGLYGASLVDVVAFAAGFAETECALAQTLCVFHDPHRFVL